MSENRSVLDEVFLEEYDRVLRRIHAIQRELKLLPKGSVSRKIINGSEAFYLSFREGNKVVTKYLKKDDVEKTRGLVEMRRRLELNMRESKKQAKKLEKVLGKEILNEYRAGNGIP